MKLKILIWFSLDRFFSLDQEVALLLFVFLYDHNSVCSKHMVEGKVKRSTGTILWATACFAPTIHWLGSWEEAERDRVKAKDSDHSLRSHCLQPSSQAMQSTSSASATLPGGEQRGVCVCVFDCISSTTGHISLLSRLEMLERINEGALNTEFVSCTHWILAYLSEWFCTRNNMYSVQKCAFWIKGDYSKLVRDKKEKQ